jgi:hypothetical protein
LFLSSAVMLIQSTIEAQGPESCRPKSIPGTQGKAPQGLGNQG